MDRHIEIEVRQFCPLSYVVGFHASIDLIQGQDDVEVISVSVRAGDDTLTERAANSIKRGILAVLKPYGVGAKVRISNLLLHCVDFSEKKFEQFTIEYLRRAIGESKE